MTSVADERLRVAAMKAALVFEAALLREQQRIAQNKLQLEHEEVRLKLETQIAKALAQERVFEEFTGDRKVPREEVKVKVEQPEFASSQGLRTFNQDTAVTVGQRGYKEGFGPTPSAPEGSDTNRVKENIFLMQTIKKVQENMERQLFSQRLPKAESVQFDDIPLNYFLFITSFENNVHKYTKDNSERLQLLIQHCSGKARELIMSCGMMNADEGYAKARKLLEERFGDKYKVTNAWIRRVSEGPVIRAADRGALQDLAHDLESCEMTLRVTGRLGQINNEDRLLKILGRVPGFVKSRWQKRVQEIRKKGRVANIEDVRSVIRAAAKNDPVFGGIMDVVSKDERARERTHKRQNQASSKATDSASTLIPRNSTVETVARSLRATFAGGTTSYQSARPFKAKLASSS